MSEIASYKYSEEKQNNEAFIFAAKCNSGERVKLKEKKSQSKPNTPKKTLKPAFIFTGRPTKSQILLPDNIARY